MKQLLTGFALSASILGGAVSNDAAALNIVLTNDDGWSAQGIQAMKSALVGAGHSVVLSGSLTQQSASSAAINLSSLEIVKQNSMDGALEYSVALSDGITGAEPVTAGAVGISIAETVLGGAAPDLLISGINAGQNTGAIALLSGTVGAANSALSTVIGNHQLPAIAISTDERCDDHTPECEALNQRQFDTVAQWLVDFIATLESVSRSGELMPQGVGLNINYPPADQIYGARIARQGQVGILRGVPSSVVYGCREECVDVDDGTAVAGGVLDYAPVSLQEARDADTTLTGLNYVAIVPIDGDFSLNKKPRKGSRKFLSKLRRTLRMMGY
ncbi:5'/3'-nucleotidase SurE [Parahaliea mediterranea]|uniref:5'/3'-nucleotidase SurE n=1 Tax=Parahaliea mediterranea TaxID=651086 RepID=UPI00130067CF|nr:5'/3'-nucleotidase SurE [Parahaliea mediterranea]